MASSSDFNIGELFKCIGRLEAKLANEEAAHEKTRTASEFLLQQVVQLHQDLESSQKQLKQVKTELKVLAERDRKSMGVSMVDSKEVQDSQNFKKDEDLLGDIMANFNTTVRPHQPLPPVVKSKVVEKPTAPTNGIPEAEWEKKESFATNDRPTTKPIDRGRFNYYFMPKAGELVAAAELQSTTGTLKATEEKALGNGRRDSEPFPPAPRSIREIPREDIIYDNPRDFGRGYGNYGRMNRHERPPRRQRSRTPPRRMLPTPPAGRSHMSYADMDKPAEVPSFGLPTLVPGFTEDFYDDQPSARLKVHFSPSASDSLSSDDDDEEVLSGPRNHEDVFYTPADGEVEKTFRTILIDNISKQVSLAQVMKQVTTGFVVSAKLLDVAWKQAFRAVFVEFLTVESAKLFTKKAELTPLEFGIGRKPARVSLLKTPTRPLDTDVKEAILGRGATRVLIITDTPPSMLIPGNLKRYLLPSPTATKTWVQEVDFLEDDMVRVIFENVKAAMTIYEKTKASPLFSNCSLYFEMAESSADDVATLRKQVTAEAEKKKEVEALEECLIPGTRAEDSESAAQDMAKESDADKLEVSEDQGYKADDDLSDEDAVPPLPDDDDSTSLTEDSQGRSTTNPPDAPPSSPVLQALEQPAKLIDLEDGEIDEGNHRPLSTESRAALEELVEPKNLSVEEAETRQVPSIIVTEAEATKDEDKGQEDGLKVAALEGDQADSESSTSDAANPGDDSEVQRKPHPSSQATITTHADAYSSASPVIQEGWKTGASIREQVMGSMRKSRWALDYD